MNTILANETRDYADIIVPLIRAAAACDDVAASISSEPIELNPAYDTGLLWVGFDVDIHDFRGEWAPLPDNPADDRTRWLKLHLFAVIDGPKEATTMTLWPRAAEVSHDGQRLTLTFKAAVPVWITIPTTDLGVFHALLLEGQQEVASILPDDSLHKILEPAALVWFVRKAAASFATAV